jgi:hypothetical protein
VEETNGGYLSASKNDTQRVMKECIYSRKLIRNVETSEDLNRILPLVLLGGVHDYFLHHL